MKFVLCLLLSLVCLLSPVAPAWGETPADGHEFLVLMTFGGTQNGGDEAAFIDEKGGFYYIDMAAENLYWMGDETLAMLRALPDDYRIGTLTQEELAEVRRLIDGIGNEKPVSYGMSACDAGSFRQIAYQPAESGEPQEVLLLCAGDSLLENMNRNAVILSSWLLDRMDFSHHLGRWSYLFPYSDSVPLFVSFETGSFSGGSCLYTLRRLGDRALLTAQGSNGDETNVSAELDDAEGFFEEDGIFTRLQKLIDDEGIAAWNGFDERDAQLLDGHGFSLYVDYGTSEIRAKGYERYPEGFARTSRELEGFFEMLILDAQRENQ